MVIKEVVMKLRPEETLRLTRILLDEDKRRSHAVLEGMPETATRQSDEGPLSACLRGFV